LLKERWQTLNSACKLKFINQVDVKPAAILKAVPGYFSAIYRGSKFNAWESVEWLNVLCVGDSMADCLLVEGY